MSEIIDYLERGYTLSELAVQLLMLIAILITIVRAIEKFLKWAADKLSGYYKRKKGIEDKDKTIDKHTQELKELANRFDKLVDAFQTNLDRVIEKMDEQQKQLDKFDADAKRRDCAVLRDRILAGMRYFGQFRDSEGRIHIRLSDYENMDHMFDEYFGAGGNGVIEKIHKHDFKHAIIENDTWEGEV